jgi:hypothetical protein
VLHLRRKRYFLSDTGRVSFYFIPGFWVFTATPDAAAPSAALPNQNPWMK